MKIAQVAPLYEAVPPRLYGGTERIVAFLSDALVDLGHDVTLFASADAATATAMGAPISRSSSTAPILTTRRAARQKFCPSSDSTQTASSPTAGQFPCPVPRLPGNPRSTEAQPGSIEPAKCCFTR